MVEFRRVESKEVAQQERVRLDAQRVDRIGKSGQSELFSASDFADSGLSSFESDRSENLKRAGDLLVDLVRRQVEIDYEVARTALLEIPMVWDRDIQEMVAERAQVIGLKSRERVPKQGHRLRLKT